MTFLPVGVTVQGVTAMLDDEGARPQSLVTGTLIFLSAKTLTRGNPRMDLHTDVFPGLTIQALKIHDRRNTSFFKHFIILICEVIISTNYAILILPTVLVSRKQDTNQAMAASLFYNPLPYNSKQTVAFKFSFK